MTREDERWVLQPSEGERVPASAGQRAAVGLAALVLVGGVLVAIGNLSAQNGDPSSQASPGASSSPSASRTARPSPTERLPREVAVVPGTLPPAPTGEPSFAGWIRAEADIVIRTAPSPDAVEVGILPAGQLAYVTQGREDQIDVLEGDWYQIIEPLPQGWVAQGEAAELVHRLSPAVAPNIGAEVWGLRAGPDGFVAAGWKPWANGYGQFVASGAVDGARWREIDSTEFGGFTPSMVGSGPAGWLAIVPVQGNDEWVFHSSDAESWTPLGVMRGLGGELVIDLVGSDLGYVVTTSAHRLWFSQDGETWVESEQLIPGGPYRLAPVPGGFYAWRGMGMRGLQEGEGAFSSDGRRWTPVLGGPVGDLSQVVAAGDRAVGLDTDPETGAVRAWEAAVLRDAVLWSRQTAAEGAFEGATVSTLVSDGAHAMAFGWDRQTEAPLTWTLVESNWTRSPLPEDFGGLPRLAAGGAGGFVAVGYRPTLRGQNPVIWNRDDDGSWAPEPTPMLPAAPNPTADECGEPPDDAIGFHLLERALAIICFGDRPITFRAWSSPCEVCYGVPVGTSTPDWLAAPTENQLYLSPIEGGHAFTSVVLAPSVRSDPAWTSAWLEVTGHFDDPAAASCRWEPTLEELTYYPGRDQFVIQCRSAFVVTAVSVVEGP